MAAAPGLDGYGHRGFRGQSASTGIGVRPADTTENGLSFSRPVEGDVSKSLRAPTDQPLLLRYAFLREWVCAVGCGPVGSYL
jgi:hypothetical protein